VGIKVPVAGVVGDVGGGILIVTCTKLLTGLLPFDMAAITRAKTITAESPMSKGHNERRLGFVFILVTSL
jgi:hypothetical protein